MKIGIYGYGNLGRGVEAALRQNPDMEIVGVFIPDPASQAGASFVMGVLKVWRYRDGILLYGPSGCKDRFGAGIALGADRHADGRVCKDQL